MFCCCCCLTLNICINSEKLSHLYRHFVYYFTLKIYQSIIYYNKTSLDSLYGTQHRTHRVTHRVCESEIIVISLKEFYNIHLLLC